MANEYRLMDIDPALWQRVKVAAMRAGMTLRAWIFEAIREKLQKEGKS